MDFLEKILVAKKKEVAAMPEESLTSVQAKSSFLEKLTADSKRMHVIGEIKRASPSKGDINTAVDIIQQAKSYEEGGVSAISVLTDPIFFKGSIKDLAEVVKAVQVPVLCKDFIISEKQLIRAKNAGVSLVLLIVAALSNNRLQELYDTACQMGLEVLVETHNVNEIHLAKKIGARLIGVNNRDLTTFKVTLETSHTCQQPADGHFYISESGIKTKEDVAGLVANYHGVLVGETLMRSGNPADTINELKVMRP
jgi:indole-3-glycerol phosphate synthase